MGGSSNFLQWGKRQDKKNRNKKILIRHQGPLHRLGTHPLYRRFKLISVKPGVVRSG